MRQAVDGLGNVLFNLARPLMEVVGLGAVAREEVSHQINSHLIDTVTYLLSFFFLINLLIL